MSFLALLLVVVLAACSGEGGRAAAPAVRDSAGIRIVENVEAAWAAPWAIGPDPVVSIGALEGAPEYEFTRIVGAVRLSDGRIVVADATSQELRYFDDQGRFSYARGGHGGGPGEFQRLSQISWLAGDSLFAHEMFGWRASIFDDQGEFARSFTYDAPGTFLRVMSVGHLADGSFLAIEGAFPVQVPGPARIARSEQTLFRYSSTGGPLEDFGSFPGREISVTPNSRGNFSQGPREFGRGTTYLAGGDRVFVADNASYEIQVYGADRQLESLFRRLVQPIPVTASDVEALREPRLENADEDRRRLLTEYFDGLPAPPATMPAYGWQLQPDRGGNLWVLEYERPADQDRRRWAVFNPEGVWLGTVRLPDGFDLMDAGDDWVLGRVKDEFDVEYVRLYGLIKPGGDERGVILNRP